MGVILGGFSAIKLAHSGSPLLVAVYLTFNVNATVVYIAIFQLGYKVTETSEKLKEVIELRFTGLGFPAARKCCERILRSIPVLAVNVGGFHGAERDAVPVFLDFALKQVVGLLITF